jgi:hypothetical protein
MLGRSNQRELEARCLELVRDSERQRVELCDACREVKDHFKWVETFLSVAKSSGPLLVGAAGVAGLLLGRGRKGGILSWIPRLDIGMKVFGFVRQFLRERKQPLP